MNILRARSLVLSLTALLVVGCGSDDDDTGTVSPGGAAGTVSAGAAGSGGATGGASGKGGASGAATAGQSGAAGAKAGGGGTGGSSAGSSGAGSTAGASGSSAGVSGAAGSMAGMAGQGGGAGTGGGSGQGGASGGQGGSSAGGNGQAGVVGAGVGGEAGSPGLAGASGTAGQSPGQGGSSGQGGTTNAPGGSGGMAGASGQGGAGPGGSPAQVKQVVASSTYSCALLEGGKVKCWGYNLSGTLGLGDTKYRGGKPGDMGDSLPTLDLGTGVQAISLTAGDDHTCALLSDGRVKCWGENNSGQLGLGDKTSRGFKSGQMGDALPFVDLGTGAKAIALAGGHSHTCAVLTDGRVKCWGDNEFDVAGLIHHGYGQLGLGDQVNHGDDPGEMGDNLPAVALGTGVQATAISADFFHTCALLAGGRVKCWGYNYNGVLGVGDFQDRGDQPGEMGDALPFIDLGTGTTILSLATGRFHTCAVLADGRLKCWGGNEYGQLGLGDTGLRGDKLAQMGDKLPAVDLGTGLTAASVESRRYQSCAVLTDGRLKCWGVGTSGALGLGDTKSRGNLPGQMGDALPFVDLGTGATAVGVTVGGEHTCSWLASGRVKCWGDNFYGQLGLGDTLDRGDQAGEMGDKLPFVALGTAP